MKQHKIFKTALLVFALLVLLTAGLVLDSKYHLQLTEYDLSFRKLPESFDGCKVLQLSDGHGASFGPGNRRLVDLVRQQNPDIIVLTGDIAGKDGALDNVEPLLTGIEGLAPTYYVNGNHEWADGCVEEIEALMESRGVICLSNEIELLYRGEDSIAIVGNYRVICGITQLSMGESMNEEDVAVIDKTGEKLKELAPNIRMIQDDNTQNALLNGEASVAFLYTSQVTQSLMQCSTQLGRIILIQNLIGSEMVSSSSSLLIEEKTLVSQCTTCSGR